MSKLVSEFKEFAMRGNVMDMAVGIIIGGAFGKIVSSLVADVIMPPITLLTSGSNIEDLKWVLREAVIEGGEITRPDRPEVAMTVGTFLQAVLDFFIIAFVIFMLIKGMNKLRKAKPEEPAAPAEPSDEVKLLGEIKELLKKQAEK